MKKKAWTLVELFIAMGIVIMVSSLLINAFRPNVQKAKLFTYATMNNINKGIIGVMEKYQNDVSSSKLISYQNPDSTDDTFCLEFTDLFSLTGLPECSQDSIISDINARFPNEVTIQGLANPWKTPYENSEYSFKNIIIDIDGENGLNKIWVDRFPLRIFQGGKADGQVMPINCEDDSIYDNENNKITLNDSTGKSPYCKQKFDATGTIANKNFLLDDQIINYDVIKSQTIDEKNITKIVASAQSLAKADCMAYGGSGYLNKKQCAELGIKIHTQCANSETCEKCSETSPSVCPMNKENTIQTDETTCLELAEQNKVNDEETKCFTLQHRPTGGASFLLETIVGEIN